MAPLPEGSELWRKGVASDPSLRDPAGIGHMFTDEMLRELKVGGGGFLLPAEEDRFRRMLGRHGKAFAFSPKEIGCVDPTIVELMVFSRYRTYRGISNQFRYPGRTSRS
jgi:hypothetical protein